MLSFACFAFNRSIHGRKTAVTQRSFSKEAGKARRSKSIFLTSFERFQLF